MDLLSFIALAFQAWLIIFLCAKAKMNFIETLIFLSLIIFLGMV